ncbi:MAG: DUF2807 domain-containing protein, partial [Bacteroidota bacterium]
MKNKLLALVLAAVSVAGCEYVEDSPFTSGPVGTGDLGTRTYEVGAFTKIFAGHGYIVDVVVGPERSVKATAEANILPMVTAEVNGGLLELSTKNWKMKPTVPVRIEVTTPDLAGLSGGGRAKVTITDIDAPRFTVDAGGGLDASLSGSAEELVLDLSRGAFVNAASLNSDLVRVKATGNSDALVYPDLAIDYDASSPSET